MNATAAPPELHLPDLPEVPVTLGLPPLPPAPPGATRGRAHWAWRLRQALAGYLPLLLMALLALGTWWLVKNTPRNEPPAAAAPPRHEPDYQMQRFTIERYTPQGTLKLRIDGDTLRHYPDVDRVEIDAVRIRAIAPDGRVTDAVARRALANGDATEVQLLGGAKVRATTPDGVPVEIESEFLHAFLEQEKLRTHLPVTVRQGRSVARAGGMEYDHLTRQLVLQGPVRAVFQPRGSKPLQ